MAKTLFTIKSESEKSFVSIAEFISDRFTPVHMNDTTVSLVKYDSINEKVNLYQIDCNLKGVTDIEMFRKLVTFWYYRQLLENAQNELKTLSDIEKNGGTLNDKQLSKQSALKVLERLYSEVLSLNIFTEPCKEGVPAVSELAKTDVVSCHISSCLTGNWYELKGISEAVKQCKAQWELCNKDKVTQNELKDSYQKTRSCLETVANNICFADTAYSEKYIGHVNQTFIRGTVNEIVSRIYKGRSISTKSGKVVRKYDDKGVAIRKELVLALVEKMHK